SFVMNDYSQPPPGKISEHGNGIGAPSPEEVERRAREIAMIDERNPDEFTQADWTQERHELIGEENNVPPEETPENDDLNEEWSVTGSPAALGFQRGGTEEDEGDGEQWVTGAMEEAPHVEVLDVPREERAQEGEMPYVRPPSKPPPQRRRRNHLLSPRANPI